MTKLSLVVFTVAFVLAGALYYQWSMQSTSEMSAVTDATATPSEIGNVGVTLERTATVPVIAVTSSRQVTSKTPPPSSDRLGMKLYRNEEFGFEFWYPEGWDLQDKTNLSPRSKLYLRSNLPEDYTLTMDSFSVDIVSPEFADYAAQNENVSKVMISGVQGKMYRYTLEGVSSSVVDLPIGGRRMLISSQHEGELKDILSTFKFIK